MAGNKRVIDGGDWFGFDHIESTEQGRIVYRRPPSKKPEEDPMEGWYDFGKLSNNPDEEHHPIIQRVKERKRKELELKEAKEAEEARERNKDFDYLDSPTMSSTLTHTAHLQLHNGPLESRFYNNQMPSTTEDNHPSVDLMQGTIAGKNTSASFEFENGLEPSRLFSSVETDSTSEMEQTRFSKISTQSPLDFNTTPTRPRPHKYSESGFPYTIQPQHSQTSGSALQSHSPMQLPSYGIMHSTNLDMPDRPTHFALSSDKQFETSQIFREVDDNFDSLFGSPSILDITSTDADNLNSPQEEASPSMYEILNKISNNITALEDQQPNLGQNQPEISSLLPMDDHYYPEDNLEANIVESELFDPELLAEIGEYLGLDQFGSGDQQAEAQPIISENEVVVAQSNLEPSLLFDGVAREFIASPLPSPLPPSPLSQLGQVDLQLTFKNPEPSPWDFIISQRAELDRLTSPRSPFTSPWHFITSQMAARDRLFKDLGVVIEPSHEKTMLPAKDSMKTKQKKMAPPVSNSNMRRTPNGGRVPANTYSTSAPHPVPVSGPHTVTLDQQWIDDGHTMMAESPTHPLHNGSNPASARTASTRGPTPISAPDSDAEYEEWLEDDQSVTMEDLEYIASVQRASTQFKQSSKRLKPNSPHNAGTASPQLQTGNNMMMAPNPHHPQNSGRAPVIASNSSEQQSTPGPASSPDTQNQPNDSWDSKWDVLKKPYRIPKGFEHLPNFRMHQKTVNNGRLALQLQREEEMRQRKAERVARQQEKKADQLAEKREKQRKKSRPRSPEQDDAESPPRKRQRRNETANAASGPRAVEGLGPMGTHAENLAFLMGSQHDGPVFGDGTASSNSATNLAAPITSQQASYRPQRALASHMGASGHGSNIAPQIGKRQRDGTLKSSNFADQSFLHQPSMHSGRLSANRPAPGARLDPPITFAPPRPHSPPGLYQPAPTQGDPSTSVPQPSSQNNLNAPARSPGSVIDLTTPELPQGAFPDAISREESAPTDPAPPTLTISHKIRYLPKPQLPGFGNKGIVAGQNLTNYRPLSTLVENPRKRPAVWAEEEEEEVETAPKRKRAKTAEPKTPAAANGKGPDKGPGKGKGQGKSVGRTR